jgi:pyrrolidone-carboxylate peptidase
MATDLKPIEAKIADAIIAYGEQPNVKQAIVDAINKSEGGVEALLEKAVDSVTVHGVVLPIVWPQVRAAIVAELKSLEAQDPGSVVFQLLDKEAHAFAASLGG